MAVTSKNKEKLLRHVTFVDFRGVYIAFRAGMCSKKAASNQKLYSMIRWSLMINVRAPLWLRQAATALPLCHQSSKVSNASVLTNIFGSIMFYHVPWYSCSYNSSTFHLNLMRDTIRKWWQIGGTCFWFLIRLMRLWIKQPAGPVIRGLSEYRRDKLVQSSFTSETANRQMGAEGNCRFTESNQFGLELIQREIKTWNAPLISQSQRFPKIPEAFKRCHFFGITRSIARPWHCQMTARQNPARLRYLCRLQSENYTLPGTGTCLSLLRLWLWRLWLAQFDWHPAKNDLCQIYKQLDRKWSHHLPLCCQEWIYPTFA